MPEVLIVVKNSFPCVVLAKKPRVRNTTSLMRSAQYRLCLQCFEEHIALPSQVRNMFDLTVYRQGQIDLPSCIWQCAKTGDQHTEVQMFSTHAFPGRLQS